MMRTRGRRTLPAFYSAYSANSTQTLDATLRVLNLAQDREKLWIKRDAGPSVSDFVIPVAGWYEVQVVISATKTTTGTSDLRVFLYRNTGGGFALVAAMKAYGGIVGPGVNGAGGVALGSIVKLGGGDKIQFQYQSLTAAANIALEAEGAQAWIRRMEW